MRDGAGGGAAHRKAFSKPISDGSQGHKPQPTFVLIKSKKEMNPKKKRKGGPESDSLDKQDGPWSSFRGGGGGREGGRLSGVMGGGSFLMQRDGRKEGGSGVLVVGGVKGGF